MVNNPQSAVSEASHFCGAFLLPVAYLCPMNLLHLETSPYLLQHAGNPVHWRAWNPETLALARRENKLLLISVGYAACHWCHVMEHETFANAEAADLMNRHFVCVKVDREERPDVDKVYMDAVQIISGSGGWPLNVVALPDGRPIFGGTYFRRPQWMSVLNQLATLWRDNPGEARRYAENMQQALENISAAPTATAETLPTPADIAHMTEHWAETLDEVWGGRKSSRNKFPLPQNNLFLLRSSDHADLTLDRMILGGMYDHVGGGFARYSVDTEWHVPHFEKMLYDNAQLISLYAEAFRKTGKQRYADVVRETLAFVARELTAPDGGFFSALDADSEGEEGKFYVWTTDDLQQYLRAEADDFADAFDCTEAGNWEEGKNVLWMPHPNPDAVWQWRSQFTDALARLRAARETRIRPGTDDKILTSWNALMIRGYVDAFRALDEDNYLQTAIRQMEFLLQAQTRPDGGLWRSHKAGRSTIPAFLDDYANLADALLALYEATFDERWVARARALADYVLAAFAHAESPLLYYTEASNDPLVVRSIDITDDVTPSGNAMIAKALHTLGTLTGELAYTHRAEAMLRAVWDDVSKHPEWHAVWSQLAMRMAGPEMEIVFAGPQAHSLAREWDKQIYIPTALIAGTDKPSELGIVQDRYAENTRIFVCINHACRLPVASIEEAIKLL